jgi:hypothetical protein
MRTLIAAIACAAMLVWSGVSQAAQLASPTIYGTADQFLAECAIINGGTHSQAVTVKIISEFGETIGPESCGGPTLAAGDACSISLIIDNLTAYACVASAGSVANLRGGLVFHRHVVDGSGILVLHPIRFAPLR